MLDENIEKSRQILGFVTQKILFEGHKANRERMAKLHFRAKANAKLMIISKKNFTIGLFR